MKMTWKDLRVNLAKGTFFLAMVTVPLLSSCDQGNSGTNTDGGGTQTTGETGTDESSGMTTDTTSTGTSSGTDTASGSGTGGT